MSFAEYNKQLDNERLRAALMDAVAYLRLMPRVPVTSAKIAELENALNHQDAIGLIEEDKEWKIEQFTPAGKALRMRFAGGSLRFETEVALREGATFGEELSVAQLDALIDALVTRRQNII